MDAAVVPEAWFGPGSEESYRLAKARKFDLRRVSVSTLKKIP